MPSLNLRLEHWQLEQLRVRAREDGRSIQRFVENQLFPRATVPTDGFVAAAEAPLSVSNTRQDVVSVEDEAISPISAAQGDEAVVLPGISAAEAASKLQATVNAGPSLKRQRRVRCEHRIPAGSYCPRCDQ